MQAAGRRNCGEGARQGRREDKGRTITDDEVGAGTVADEGPAAAEPANDEVGAGTVADEGPAAAGTCECNFELQSVSDACLLHSPVSQVCRF